MILLDTHVLLWWVGEDPALPPKVRKLMERHKRAKTLSVSAMSVWEIAILHKKGRLQLAFDLQIWIDRLVALPFLQMIPVDHAIFLKSVMLPEPFHSDPADRVIVATAMKLGIPLVTRDDKIRKYPYLKTYWEEG